MSTNAYRITRESLVGRRANLLKNSLLFSDRSLIIINKPSGLICQDVKHMKDNSEPFGAVNLLLEDVRNYFALKDRAYPVHRLDKLTTGTWCIARSKQAARPLSAQFRTHIIFKNYLALVRAGRRTFEQSNTLTPASAEEVAYSRRTGTPTGVLRGRIDVGIMIGTEGDVSIDAEEGKIALSDWELLGTSTRAPLSLLRLRLHTGLKHQLRIHLSHVLGAPVLGDTLYSNSPPAPEILALLPKGISVSPSPPSHLQASTSTKASAQPQASSTPAMFLHASHISFERYRRTYPHKQFRHGVTSPVPPAFLETCRAAGLSSLLTQTQVKGGIDIDGIPLNLDDLSEAAVGDPMQPNKNLGGFLSLGRDDADLGIMAGQIGQVEQKQYAVADVMDALERGNGKWEREALRELEGRWHWTGPNKLR